VASTVISNHFTISNMRIAVVMQADQFDAQKGAVVELTVRTTTPYIRNETDG
jgi:hypothetical protein